MYDGTNHRSGQPRRSKERGKKGDHHGMPLPRELAIAAAALTLIMVATGLALWIVAGHTGSGHVHPQANTTVGTPTDDLLQTLAEDLGPSTTNAELEAAVLGWLTEQEHRGTVRLASTTASR